MNDKTERETLEKLEREAEGLAAELGVTLEKIETELEHDEDERTPFTISVNNKDVAIVGHEHTGLEIKQAAIVAGVAIETDFVLSEELSHGRSRIVGDDQRIKISRESRFEAIPNDDHS